MKWQICQFVKRDKLKNNKACEKTLFGNTEHSEKMAEHVFQKIEVFIWLNEKMRFDKSMFLTCVFDFSKKIVQLETCLYCLYKKSRRSQTKREDKHTHFLWFPKMFVLGCLGPKDSKNIRRHSFPIWAESGPREHRHRIPNWKPCRTHSSSPQGDDLAAFSLSVALVVSCLSRKN
jgi:hypothetical protein